VDWISNPEIWASLLTLTALEIVLGIDNLVFIAILAGRLPAEQQNRARQIGLALALLTRLALLASITWIIGLTQPLFELFGHIVSWRDTVLIAGGLFLLYKGTREIHHALEDNEPKGEEEYTTRQTTFAGVVTQIMLLDVVFSLDSVITAVGMANTVWVMATAIIIAVMMSFLMLIGMTLIADGAGFHVPKGYIYAAIGFSVGVEALNQLAARRRRLRRGIRSAPPIKHGGGAANTANGEVVC
jgi:predicted tellurium resistance membrane protein TerC